MNWFPLFALLLLGTVCKVNCRLFPKALSHSIPGKLSIVGHFGIGLLLGWLGMCLLRGLVTAIIAPSWRFSDLALSPIQLFYFEGWILLGSVVVELWYLKGNYKVQDECKATFWIGIRTASTFIALATLVAIPVWWAIRPGEYGTFEGTIVHDLVSDRAMAIFDINVANGVSADKVAWSQNARAIPDALIIAALLVSLKPLVKPLYRYFRMVLNDDYLHLPPKKKKDEGAQQHNFPHPRGKRVMDEW